MSSFYGNLGGTGDSSSEEVNRKIQETKNHIIFSKTQPTVQKTGDIWVIIVSDDKNNG